MLFRSNLVFEGNQTSLIRRETEKFLNMLNTRNDIAGRLMQEFHMAADVKEFERDVYMKDVCSQYLDIELGVRMYTHGEAVNRVTTFVPVAGGENAIDRIYYNIENMILDNLVSFDETHDHYLPVSEELVCRELESLIQRSRRKGNTRKKLVNGLTVNTVLLDDPTSIHSISLADLYYDKLNRIDLLDEASARSRDLYAANLIRSTEVTNEVVPKVDSLKMEERVYIDRNAAVGAQPYTAAPSRTSWAPQTAPVARAEPAKEKPAKEPVTVATDGLEEL